MDGLTIDHRLFQMIRNDHNIIREKLNNLFNNSDLKSSVEWLWNEVELKHHFKEETILFHHLLKIPAVNSGGPLCMLYFDHYLMSPPLERCQKATQTSPPTEDHQKEFFDTASSMRIPVNEHRAGKEILRYSLEFWHKLPSERINNLLNLYKDIQIQHMEKEENCFIHMCANLMSPVSAEELAQCWEAT